MSSGFGLAPLKREGSITVKEGYVQSPTNTYEWATESWLEHEEAIDRLSEVAARVRAGDLVDPEHVSASPLSDINLIYATYKALKGIDPRLDRD